MSIGDIFEVNNRSAMVIYDDGKWVVAISGLERLLFARYGKALINYTSRAYMYAYILDGLPNEALHAMRWSRDGSTAKNVKS